MKSFVMMSVTTALAIVMTATMAGPDEAPADAWPMARGTLAGTGRSATRVSFPLVEAWHRTFDTTAFEATPVIAGGTIYVGDLDGTFHALALDSGQTRWTFTVDAGFPSAAAVSSGAELPLVVVGDGEGIVRALDLETGKVRWEYRTGAEISGGPTIIAADDGLRALIGSQDATLSCLRLIDGTAVWKHEIADQIRCSPTVAEGAVFVAGCDGSLHVIDVTTGKKTASVAIDGPTGTTPAAHEGRVFFGTEGGIFYGIDIAPARDAHQAWKTEAGVKGRAYRSSAAITGDLAVVGSRGRAIEAFSRADGAQRWRHPMRGRVDGAAVADGRIVLASGDGTIWCFATAPLR